MLARRAVCQLLPLLLAHAATASAQEKPTDVVVTGTRTKESSQRATVRTDYVTRKEAERRGATNVAEALAGEPTLQVNPGSYGHLGRPSGVQIQGLDADRVLVLEDGERVIGDKDGIVDLATLPLADVERIEYVAGPSSSLYGSNALGGVINIVSAPPGAEGPSGRYRAELRSSGHVLSSANGAYRQGPHWLSLDSSWQRRPGVERQPDKPDLIAPRWRSTLVGLRAGTRIGSRADLALRARWVRDHSEGLQSENAPGLGVYLIDLPQVTDRFLLRAQERLRLPGGGHVDFSLTRNWFFDDYRRDRRSSPLDERRYRELSNQALEGIVTLPDGASRTWVFGLRSEAEHFSQSLTRTLPDLSDERITEIDPRLLASSALYGQLGWKVTERWTVMPGARLELHDRYGAEAAPRLATSFRFSDTWSARLSLGRGFRAPTAKELGFQFDHSALGYRILGNGALRPESSWGLNGDVTARHGRWRVRGGAFANWVRDLIIVDFAPEQPTAGVVDYVYRNAPRARTAGGDVGARFKAFEAISLGADYAFLWTRDLASAEELPNRPSHTVTLSTELSLAKWLFTARYRVVSGAYAGRIEDVARRTPGFDTLDLRLLRRLSSALELFVGVLNLTDSRRRSLDVTDTRPVVGRQLYVGISGELGED